MASRASAAVAGWQAATTPPASIRNRIQPMPSCAADAALAQHPLRSKDGAGAHVPALFLRLPTGGRREGRYSRAEDFFCGGRRRKRRKRTGGGLLSNAWATGKSGGGEEGRGGEGGCSGVEIWGVAVY